MASSKIYVKDLGEVHVFRRRGLKNIRLRVDTKGNIRLSIPWFVPKSAGATFVRAKKDWVQEQLSHRTTNISDIKSIGRYKLLVTEIEAKRASHKVEDDCIHIKLPSGLSEQDREKTITSAIEKVFRDHTKETIAERLRTLAKQSGFKVESIKVRKLVSRWGSCDHKTNITLSIYLALLPEDLVDYVLHHELAHTLHLNHSFLFWEHVRELCPDYVLKKKQLAKFSPGLLGMR